VRLGIDHLVVAVPDPDAAAALVEAAIGLAVTGGGRHELAGTYNRLAFLGDTYLELIGVFDRDLVAAPESSPVGRAAMAVLDDGREGLATYALAVDDVAAEVARLRAAGSPIGDGVPGSRRRADGEVVRWVTAFPTLGPDRPPFLIEHEPAGAEWGPAARAARAAFRHPVGGAVRLAGLVLPVPDIEAASRRYRDELGLELDAGDTTRVGGQSIGLIASSGGRVPVVDLVGERGAAPLDVVLCGIRWRRRAA
jgi:catechol 2,3-dioxygenase-like lactoylglutathione lyase family enzyme